MKKILLIFCFKILSLQAMLPHKRSYEHYNNINESNTNELIVSLIKKKKNGDLQELLRIMF